MWKRLKCYLGYHRWQYADYVRVNDFEYWGPINHVVACVSCGKRQFLEGM